MVTADGRVKIADFGIAKATTQMQTGAFLTATGTTVGTPTYMAPEQAMAQDIGPWTDLYSVGCMAYELFTGHVPFHDSDAPMAILLRHVNEPIPPVTSIGPEVDQGHLGLDRALLVKDPAARTQNAEDAWDAFEEILHRPARPALAARGAAGRARRSSGGIGAKPLTPAPFQGTNVGDVASEEFKSFAWGAPSDTGGAAPRRRCGRRRRRRPRPRCRSRSSGPRRRCPRRRSRRRHRRPRSRSDANRGATPASPASSPSACPPRAPPSRRAADARLPRPSRWSSRRRSPSPRSPFETYVAPPPSRPPTSEPKAITPPPVEAVAVPAPLAFTPPPGRSRAGSRARDPRAGVRPGDDHAEQGGSAAEGAQAPEAREVRRVRAARVADPRDRRRRRAVLLIIILAVVLGGGGGGREARRDDDRHAEADRGRGGRHRASPPASRYRSRRAGRTALRRRSSASPTAP